MTICKQFSIRDYSRLLRQRQPKVCQQGKSAGTIDGRRHQFTKIARKQIATLRRWCVLDVRAGH
jgi:hypothetical protein